MAEMNPPRSMDVAGEGLLYDENAGACIGVFKAPDWIIIERHPTHHEGHGLDSGDV